MKKLIQRLIAFYIFVALLVFIIATDKLLTQEEVLWGSILWPVTAYYFIIDKE